MTLIHGDCIEVMADMEPESVDAIVTDPPYGLEFMGKEWDRLGDVGKTSHSGTGTSDGTTARDAVYGRLTVSYSGSSNVKCRNCGKWQWDHVGRKCECERPDFPSVKAHQGRLMGEWHARWAEAAYRVAKPSAYLLAFGGTRTVHRMTVALEDAGWIIRDMLVWAYASGFPKSKASLKPAWEPIVMARKPGPLRMLAIDECRIPGTTEPTRFDPNRHSHDGYRMDATGADVAERNDGLGRWPANIILTDPIFDGGVEGVVGGGTATSGGNINGRPVTGYGGHWADSREFSGYQDEGTYSRFFLVPKSSRADREPVLDEYAYQLHKERGECVVTSPARATSVASTKDGSASSTSSSGSRSAGQSPKASRSTISTGTSETTGSPTSSPSTPSPTSASTRAASSGMESGGSPATSVASESLWEPATGISVVRDGRSTDDVDPATSGSWSRQNACARCGRPLPRFSTHPTQKPTDLMRHLVRLVTPTGGVVLDPFLGSGSTALAAEMEGFEWIGIEREAEYVAIAEARLNGTQRGLGLETA